MPVCKNRATFKNCDVTHVHLARRRNNAAVETNYTSMDGKLETNPEFVAVFFQAFEIIDGFL